MEQNKLISIVVPVYNIAPYLERCVLSIQNQSYSNIEIILVDNGSSDGSSEMVDGLAAEDSRIIPVHEESQGVTHARLTGVSRAKGDWIGFVDGDDLIEPDMYERLLMNAVRYKAQISHCGYQMVFGDGRVHSFYNTGRLVQQDTLTGLQDLLDGSYIEPGLCNKLFHKSLLHSLLHNDAMDLSIKEHEDLLMNFILFMKAEKSVYEDFCPYHYIVREDSASRGRKNANQIFDPIKVKQIIIAIAPKEIKDNAQAAFISTCVSKYNSLLTYRNMKEEKAQIRTYLQEHQIWIKLTGKHTHLMANGILYWRWFYEPLYRLYGKRIQKQKYN